jgi:hypothetical protein
LQAPVVASQPVAWQAGSELTAHPVVQQLPVPATPQMPEMQTWLLLQGPVACCATHWWDVVLQ